MSENPLFKPDKDWWNNACVNYNPYTWDLYARGYYNAAEVLFEHINNNSSARLDSLVYPVIFLYRQYIELRLKEIYYICCNLLDRSTHLKKTHDIKEFWIIVRAQIEEIEPNGSNEELDKIGSIIENFSLIDCKSDTFRYPVNTNGDPSLESDIKYINIRHFAAEMEKVYGLLEGISTMISTYQDYQNDQKAEYRNEIDD